MNAKIGGIVFLLVILVPLSLAANSEEYVVQRYSNGLQVGYISNGELEGINLLADSNAGSDASSEEYRANIGFFDGTHSSESVYIASYTIYPKSAAPGSIIRFSISARNEESVWIKIKSPNGTEDILSAINEEYAYYTTSEVGRYDVTFYANDSQGSIASALEYFDVAVTSTQSSSSSGSSGSGSSEKTSCTYIWECNAWSLCSNNLQARTCGNVGTCSGLEGKPLESRACARDVMNITVSAGELSITPQGTIRFNLTLIRNQGADAIQVQLKYTLLNAEGTEVFSQIETRAVTAKVQESKNLEVKLSEGEYTLRIEYAYGDVEGRIQEQRFSIQEDGNVGIIGNAILSLSEVSSTMKISIEIVAGFILLASLIYMIRKSKLARALRKERVQGKQLAHIKNGLSHQMNKKVYTENGTFLGTVKDIYIEENTVYGFVIAPSKSTRILVGGKAFLVRYKHVASAGQVIMIKGTIEEYLKETTSIK